MKVAILRAVGDGGLQDPQNGQYISSKRDTIAPFTSWAESLANHDRIKVVEVLEGSDWGEFVNHLGQEGGDDEKALASYRKELPSGKVEKVKVVKDAQDLERQDAQAKDTGTSGKTAVVKDAPAQKPAA